MVLQCSETSITEKFSYEQAITANIGPENFFLYSMCMSIHTYSEELRNVVVLCKRLLDLLICVCVHACICSYKIAGY